MPSGMKVTKTTFASASGGALGSGEAIQYSSTSGLQKSDRGGLDFAEYTADATDFLSDDGDLPSRALSRVARANCVDTGIGSEIDRFRVEPF